MVAKDLNGVVPTFLVSGMYFRVNSLKLCTLLEPASWTMVKNHWSPRLLTGSQLGKHGATLQKPQFHRAQLEKMPIHIIKALIVLGGYQISPACLVGVFRCSKIVS